MLHTSFKSHDDCSKCGLHESTHSKGVQGQYNKSSTYALVVSSLTTEAEDVETKAFLPKELLSTLRGFEVSYTNFIKCPLPKGKNPKVSQINLCKKVLEQEIEYLKPKIIIIVGALACKHLLKQNISDIAGSPTKYNGVDAIAIYNPAILYFDLRKAPIIERANTNILKMLKEESFVTYTPNITTVTNMGQLVSSFKLFKKDQVLAYDIETTGLDRYKSVINLFAIGDNKNQVIIPLKAKHSPLASKNKLQKELITYAVNYCNDNYKLVAGNGKFDNLFLLVHFGVKPKIAFDVVLASHVLDENTPNGVEPNAIMHLGVEKWDIPLSLKKGDYETEQEYIKYLDYLANDIINEYNLCRYFYKEIKNRPRLKTLYYNLYMPVIRTLEQVEHNGVYIDLSAMEEADKTMSKEIKEAQKEIDTFKQDLNANSPLQCSEYLFGELGLKIIEKTATGNPSTGKNALGQMLEAHPVIPLILRYRSLTTVYSLIINKWRTFLTAGRLHPSFSLLNVTGRTACQNPNIQQTPRQKQVRNLVSCDSSRYFVEMDYSQMELRIASMFANDQVMLDTYKEGGDIHLKTVTDVINQPLSDDPDIRYKQRTSAKAVNFGFIYGMQAPTFKTYAKVSYGVDLSKKEAVEWRNKYFKTYPSLGAWHSNQIAVARANMAVTSPIGRIRRLPNIYSRDIPTRMESERQAINATVQGLGSDICVLAMAEINGFNKTYDDCILDQNRFVTVANIHDALLFEVDKDYINTFLTKAKKIMETPLTLSRVFKYTTTVDMIVDAVVGTAWAKGVEIDFSKDIPSQLIKEV